MKLFREMGLVPELIQGISALGFETPTPVQEKVIPKLLEGSQDLLALAQTGTGKTAAFGLPLLQHVQAKKRQPQAIILCPTRELCMQVAGDLKNYARFLKGVRVLAVYGGASIRDQIMALKKGIHIIVATPGRMKDLLQRRKVDFSEITRVVLDEADEMLNMGFQEDLEDILSEVPEGVQKLLFSATMPKVLTSIARNYMKDREQITIGVQNAGAENVNHEYYIVQARDRYSALKRIIDCFPGIYGIVFCRTRMETKQVAEKLMSDGYSADALHGELSQAQRDSVMTSFRGKHLQILVGTDVAARGLDVSDLSHVINYNLPKDLDIYTHRSGRTGRAGKQGISISIIQNREKQIIQRLEKNIKKKFTQKVVPTGEEVCEVQLFRLLEKVKNAYVDEERIAPYLEGVYQVFQSLSKEELIKRFVSLEFNRFLDYYKNAKDLNKEGKGGDEKRKRNLEDVHIAKLTINLGKFDELTPGNLLDMVNDLTPGRTIKLGRIDIRKKNTVFEVPSEEAGNLIKDFEDVFWGDHEVVLKKADGGKSKKHPRRSKKGFSSRPYRDRNKGKSGGKKR